jgi:aryl-alcohol dehydrogenase-like predicted oxidoreductase
MTQAELGLGLIGIGRPWPTPDRTVPPPDLVSDLLNYAVASGVRFFDTAPAYGMSEERLGSFLHTLQAEARESLVVATKCGEIWTPAHSSVIDHSPEALKTSVARSVDRLGRIDLLQLHQASSEIVREPSVIATRQQLQQSYSIPFLGASVKDVEACDAALESSTFTHLQMPVNDSRPDLVAWARTNHMAITIIGNRPLASGRAVDRLGERLAYAADAVGLGIVLTGTTDRSHLAATLTEWRQRSALGSS